MKSNRQEIEPGRDDWQNKIHVLEQELDRLQPELITQEARLSEALARISAFEFQLRTHLEPLTRRLDDLQDEIALLQKQLRALRDSWIFAADPETDDLLKAWRMSADAGAAAGDAYRYHAAPAAPPQDVSAGRAEAIKKLYRQLARRFHPDFALDERDRDYRTNMMMAINVAYTLGDLPKLEQLAREPDPPRPHYTPEEMALALLRELERCQNRLAEIAVDLARLAKHPSALLQQRAQRAARQGRDLFAELASELRDRIAERMVQRDVLLAEIEAFENGEPEFMDDAFADAVFNLGLEQVLIEDRELSVAEWRERHRDAVDWGEADDEAGWEALRRARQKEDK